MSKHIQYGQLMHKAMRGLLSDVLKMVAIDGLPGEHHFFITFDTTHAGVDLSDSLRQRYPAEMTIVMQDWFDNLAVMDDRFTVTLNFGNVPEPMVIPFEAVKTFVDPSVEFGLRFDASPDDEDADDDRDLGLLDLDGLPDENDDSPDDAPKTAEVVSLDAFRKS